MKNLILEDLQLSPNEYQLISEEFLKFTPDQKSILSKQNADRLVVDATLLDTNNNSQKMQEILSKQQKIIADYQKRFKKSPSPEIVCLDETRKEAVKLSQASSTSIQRLSASSSPSALSRVCCEFCLLKFTGGLQLSALLTHLKQYHSISNPHELSLIIKRALLKNHQ